MSLCCCSNRERGDVSDTTNHAAPDTIRTAKSDTVTDTHVFDPERYQYFLNYFSFTDDSERDLYINTYTKAVENETLVSSSEYDDLKHKWIEVRMDSGQFYFFRKCEFIRRWELTDSAFVSYYTDGPIPEIVKSVNFINGDYTVKTNRSTLSFKLVSEVNEVYKFHDGSNSFLIAPINQVVNMKVFKENCDD